MTNDDFFMGESAPVSTLNTAREVRQGSRNMTEREQQLIHDIVIERKSCDSFDSNESEMYDTVVSLKGGIRRNVTDPHNIHQMEQLVFVDPIFQRHRKQPTSRLVTVSANQFVSYTTSMGNNTEKLSILLLSGGTTTTSTTPILTPMNHSSSASSVCTSQDLYLNNDDAVRESLCQARQALSEKCDNKNHLSEPLDTATNITVTSSTGMEGYSADKTRASLRMYQSLCDRERENRLLDDHDAIIAKMVMGSSRCKVKPSSSSSSSSFNSFSSSTPELPSATSIIGKRRWQSTLSSYHRAIVFFMSTSVRGGKGRVKVVVDDRPTVTERSTLFSTGWVASST